MEDNSNQTTQNSNSQHQMTEEEIEIERAKAESLRDLDREPGSSSQQQSNQDNQQQNQGNQYHYQNDFARNIFSLLGNLFQQQQQPQQNPNQNQQTQGSQQQNQQQRSQQCPFAQQNACFSQNSQQQNQQPMFNQACPGQMPFNPYCGCPMFCPPPPPPPQMYPYFNPYYYYPNPYAMPPPAFQPQFYQQSFIPQTPFIGCFGFNQMLENILPTLLELAPKFLDDLSKQCEQNGNQDMREKIQKIREIIDQAKKETKDGHCSIGKLIQKIVKIFTQRKEHKEENDQKQKGTEPVARQEITDERLENGTMRHIERRIIGNRSLSVITLTLSDGTKQTTKEKENIKDEEVDEFNNEWESIMQLE